MSKCHPGSWASVSASRGRKDNGKRQVKISFFSPVSALAAPPQRKNNHDKTRKKKRNRETKTYVYVTIYIYTRIHTHIYIYPELLSSRLSGTFAKCSFPTAFLQSTLKLVDWSCLHSLCIIRWLTWERLKILTIDHLENNGKWHYLGRQTLRTNIIWKTLLRHLTGVDVCRCSKCEVENHT